MPLKDSTAPTSLPELADGILPSSSPDGQTISLFGPDPVPASLSAQPENVLATWMPATFGPTFLPLSGPASLQRSLENRLLRRMGVYGSMEYALTWKRWDMKSGPPICALRASPRRISGRGCIGWPTPQAFDANECRRRPDAMAKAMAGRDIPGRNGGPPSNLREVVQVFAGWRTPRASDWKGGVTGSKGSKRDPADYVLPDQASMLYGWNTPRATDGSNGGPNQAGGALPADAARMGNGGALNPELSRWLMGFPAVWASYAPTVMRFSQRSRRSS